MHKNKHSYEVMIIGGGPAGNAAANCLAQNGLNTVVIDTKEKLGDKLCTGIVGQECSLLIPPDPSLIYRDAPKVSIFGPNDACYELQDSNNHAFIIDRVNYVADIAFAAQANGADYFLDHKVTELNIESDSVSASIVSPSGRHLISSEVVVVASGFGSNLIPMAGLEKHKTGDYLVGAQVNSQAPRVDHTYLFTGSAYIPGSFGWLVPTVHNEALLGAVFKNMEKDVFMAFLDHLRSKNVVCSYESPVRYWGIPVRPLKKTFAHRTLVVGDAAGFAKPTTGGGIYYAILSGLLAAETILSAEGNFDYKTMANYETLWGKKFGQELNVGYYARLLYGSLDDNSLAMLLKKFSSTEIQSYLLGGKGFSFDWHGSTISKTIQNPEIMRLLNSLGPKSLWILGKMLRSAL